MKNLRIEIEIKNGAVTEVSFDGPDYPVNLTIKDLDSQSDEPNIREFETTPIHIENALELVYELALNNSLDPAEYRDGDNLKELAEKQQEALSLISSLL